MGTNCIDDNVSRPSHYRVGGIETIDILKSKLTPEEFIGFCKGNIIKYITRCNYKGKIDDLKKAEQYCKFLLEVLDDEQA